MYIAEPEHRKIITKQTHSETAEIRRLHLDRERREFIRIAAAGIMASLPLQADLGRVEVDLYAEAAVARAKALWDELQGEDC